MMTCEEFADSVSDYLDGRVPYGKRIGMWLHSVMCVHCRRYLHQMQDVVTLLQEVREEEERAAAPTDVKEDLMERFRSRHSAQPDET